MTSNKTTSSDQNRIESLRASGRLDDEQAGIMRGALEHGTTNEVPKPMRRDWPPGKSRFLAGEITQGQLLKTSQRTAVFLGLSFGLVWPLLMWLTVWRADLFWPMGFVLGAVGGVLFGGSMYAILFRPAVLKVIALHEAVGDLQPLGLVDAGQCPECRSEEFDRSAWTHPNLHLLLSPIMAINEILFGQRTVANVKMCRHCASQVVDCPHCNSAINAMHWSKSACFGNWAGIYCPHCEGRLETQPNPITWLIRKPLDLLTRPLRKGAVR